MALIFYLPQHRTLSTNHHPASGLGSLARYQQAAEFPQFKVNLENSWAQYMWFRPGTFSTAVRYHNQLDTNFYQKAL